MFAPSLLFSNHCRNSFALPSQALFGQACRELTLTPNLVMISARGGIFTPSQAHSALSSLWDWSPELTEEGSGHSSCTIHSHHEAPQAGRLQGPAPGLNYKETPRAQLLWAPRVTQGGMEVGAKLHHSHGMQRPSASCLTFRSHRSISDVQFVLSDLAGSVGSGPTLLGDALTSLLLLCHCCSNPAKERFSHKTL